MTLQRWNKYECKDAKKEEKVGQRDDKEIVVGRQRMELGKS